MEMVISQVDGWEAILARRHTMAEQPSSPDNINRTAETAAVDPVRATWTQTRAILGVILLVLVVAAGLWMVYMLASVILLVMLAMFFAYLVAPLVDVVHRFIAQRSREREIPRAVAIGLVYLLLFGSIGTAGYLLIPQLGAQMTLFGQQAPTYMTIARDRLQAWRFLVNPDHFPPVIRDAVEKMVARSTEALEGSLSYALTGVLAFLSYLPWLVLIPILAFLLLKDAEDFKRAALRALPIGHLRGRGAELFEDINNTLAAYIRAALLGCLLISVVCTVAFMIIGVPYALLLGALAGLLEFIPLVGPLVVALGASLVASFHSVGQAVVVLVFLGLLRIVQDYVIYPRLIARGIHMHPLAVILAILCGAQLAGVAGIFLAVPVVAVLSVMHRHWLEYRGSAGLVADFLKPAAVAPSPAGHSIAGGEPVQSKSDPRA
jgi:predicted PurR-regulated permease PerM